MIVRKMEGKVGDNNRWTVWLNLTGDMESVVCEKLTHNEAAQYYNEIRSHLLDEETRFIEIKHGLAREMVSVSKIISVEMDQS